MKPKSWNPLDLLEVDNCNLAFGPLHFIATIEHMVIIRRYISDKGYEQEYVVLKKSSAMPKGSNLPGTGENTPLANSPAVKVTI